MALMTILPDNDTACGSADVSFISGSWSPIIYLIYPPSPNGLGNDAGSVTFMSFTDDAIVRVLWELREYEFVDTRRWCVQYGLAILEIPDCKASLLSMPL